MKMWFNRSAGGNPGWNNWPHLTQRSFSSCFFTGQAKTDESKSQESVRDIRSLKTRRNSAPALVFANEESMDLAELEPRISNSYRERSRRLSEIINPFPQTNQPERNSGFFPSLNWLNWISFMRSKKIADSNLRFLIPKKLNKIFLNTFLGQANEKFSVLGWSLHWFENFNSQGLKHPEKVIINYIRSLFINEVTKILRFIALPSIWHAFVNKVIKHNNVWQTIVLGRLLLPNIVISIFPKF